MGRNGSRRGRRLGLGERGARGERVARWWRRALTTAAAPGLPADSPTSRPGRARPRGRTEGAGARVPSGASRMERAGEPAGADEAGSTDRTGGRASEGGSRPGGAPQRTRPRGGPHCRGRRLRGGRPRAPPRARRVRASGSLRAATVGPRAGRRTKAGRARAIGRQGARGRRWRELPGPGGAVWAPPPREPPRPRPRRAWGKDAATPQKGRAEGSAAAWRSCTTKQTQPSWW